jgi:Peptidase propeptide and YPEB domain
VYRKMNKLHLSATIGVVVILGSSALAYVGWFTDEQPPANAKPLSEIVKSLEDQGYKVITDVEFDDGVWKIEVHPTGSNEVHLRINPISGQVAGR